MLGEFYLNEKGEREGKKEGREGKREERREIDTLSDWLSQEGISEKKQDYQGIWVEITYGAWIRSREKWWSKATAPCIPRATCSFFSSSWTYLLSSLTVHWPFLLLCMHGGK